MGLNTVICIVFDIVSLLLVFYVQELRTDLYLVCLITGVAGLDAVEVVSW